MGIWAALFALLTEPVYMSTLLRATVIYGYGIKSMTDRRHGPPKRRNRLPNAMVPIPLLSKFEQARAQRGHTHTQGIEEAITLYVLETHFAAEDVPEGTA